MPFELSPADHDRLRVVHPDLAAVVHLAASKYCEQRFVVFEGVRTLQQQRAYVAKGVSRTLRSYHLVGLAVDLVPLLPNPKARDPSSARLQPTWNVPACRTIAQAMQLAADELDIPVTWGGSWKFFDGPHFQLDTYYKAHPRTQAYLDGRAPPPPSVGSYANKRTTPHGDPREIDTAKALSAASPSEAVLEAQKLLNAYVVKVAPALAGIPRLAEDGKYGKRTEHATRLVQGHLAVRQDGIFGPATAQAVKKALTASPTPAPAPLPPAHLPLVPPPAMSPADAPGALTKKGTTYMSGKKTYLLALGLILGAVASYLQGTATAGEALTLAVNGLLAMTLRNGIDTSIAKGIAKSVEGIIGR